MTLVLCPECRAEVSDRAGQCPKCGYPLTVGSTPPVPAAEPHQPATRTSISQRFAVAWTVATGAVVMSIFVLGRGGETDAAATVGLLAVLASWIPIWWKSRGAAHASAAPRPAELVRQVDERLAAAEERMDHRLGEVEDGTRQVMELEERVDFAERLLTRYRDDQLRTPSPSEDSG